MPLDWLRSNELKTGEDIPPLLPDPEPEVVVTWSLLISLSERDLRYRWWFGTEEEAEAAIDAMTEPTRVWYRNRDEIVRVSEILSIEKTSRTSSA